MEDSDLVKLLDNLLKLGRETEWIEFKENRSITFDEIGEYISALSNSACIHSQEYGYLVFGIEDGTLNIIGTSFDPYKEKVNNQEIESWLTQHLDPKVNFELFHRTLLGKKIVILKIEAATNTPIRFKDISYIRIGSYKKKLDDYPNKARKIWLNDTNATYERGISIKDLTIEKVLDLLDYKAFFALSKQPLPTNDITIIDKLMSEFLVLKVGSMYAITNLGAILFAKNLSKFRDVQRKSVRVIVYKGKNKVETNREYTGKKGYAAGFENLIDFVNNLLPSNEVIGVALRDEVKMYPKIAIRELVANALIHQDFYEKGTGPMIEIFEDRVEISNPGEPLIDILRFIDHNPQSRNEDLAALMRRLFICEERGSGIDKVIFAVEQYQLPAPRFESSDRFTKVILLGHKTLNDMDKEDKIRACYQHCCLKYVSNERMTNTTLRERFNIPKQNYSIASRIIADTQSANLIKVSNPDNTSRPLTSYIPWWA